MKTEELNDLMVDVTNQLNEAGCEYFLSVMAKDDEAVLGSASIKDDEAVLGSASINMNDVDAAAKLISESIKQGGAYGQRMMALFGKVVTSLNEAGYESKGWSVLHENQKTGISKAFHR